MAKKHTYRIWVTGRTHFEVDAFNSTEAKNLVWKQLLEGFNYGWADKEDFMKHASFEKL